MSKLQKLVTLLEQGSVATKDHVAKQLSELQREYPSELPNLLAQITPFLFSSSWGTRVRSAKAIGLVLSHATSEQIPRFDDAVSLESSVSLSQFDGSKECSKAPLLCFACNNSEVARDTANNVAIDTRVVRQRVEAELGLDPKLGVSTKDWLSDQDIEVGPDSGLVNSSFATSERDLEPLPADAADLMGEFLNLVQNLSGYHSCIKRLAQEIAKNLLNSNWTARHGSALACKELLPHVSNVFGFGFVPLILTLLCRDKFCDFVGAHGVAPVRETVAQIFGLIFAKLKRKSEAARTFLLEAVSQLCSEVLPWQCQQSGLLCLKYVVLSEQSETKSDHLTDDGGMDMAQFLAGKFEFLKKHLMNVENDDLCFAAAEVCLAALELLKPFRMEMKRVCEETLMLETVGTSPNVCSLLSLFGRVLPFQLQTFEELITLLELLYPHGDHGLPTVRSMAIGCIWQLVQSGSRELNKGEGVFKSLSPYDAEKMSKVQNLLRFLYQRILLEPEIDIQTKTSEAWNCVIGHLSPEVIVSVTCPVLGHWLAMLMVPNENPVMEKGSLFMAHHGDGKSSTFAQSKQHLIGSDSILSMELKARIGAVLASKFRASECLALLIPTILTFDLAEDDQCPAKCLRECFGVHLSSSSFNQRSAIAILLAHVNRPSSSASDADLTSVTELLLDLVSNPLLTYEETMVTLSELLDQATTLQQFLIDQDILSSTNHLTDSIELATYLAELDTPTWVSRDVCEKVFAQKSSLNHLLSTIRKTRLETELLLVAALVNLKVLTPKFNPVLRPIMDYVKFASANPSDSSEPLLKLCGFTLAKFLELCADKLPSPNGKVIKNLFAMLLKAEREGKEASTEPTSCENHGSAPEIILRVICGHFGSGLSSTLPSLWDFLTNWTASGTDCEGPLLAISCVLPGLDSGLKVSLAKAVVPEKLIKKCLVAESARTRQLAVDALVQFLTQAESDVYEMVISCILKDLNFADSEPESEAEHFRMLGWSSWLLAVSDRLDVKLSGITPLLVPSALKWMTTGLSSESREFSAQAFANLIKVLPLEKPDPPEYLTPELVEKRSTNFEFLEQFSSAAKRGKLSLPFKLEIDLRPYQEDGVQWLWFLKEYSLGGILADDMGLGKTLQTLCVVAASHLAEERKGHVTSLVVCPGSLVQHWFTEMARYVGEAKLKALIYSGPQRKKIPPDFIDCYDIIITSYEAFRTDSERFLKPHWLFCVLDEGHVIKNPKTKLHSTLVQIRARHKLILSGTPVQNSVLELWSLFQFLMPGYLGSFASFQTKYAKPIIQSRNAKVTSEDYAKGQAALTDLHKRVLPFILRRQKSDVLSNLPPKIIQDYYCDLSDLQHKLYESFLEKLSQAKDRSGSTAFKALSYLRKLVDHPRLVMTGPELAQTPEPDLISHSGKLMALANIFEECSIGIASREEESTERVFGSHRALIFCQFKGALDLIESNLKNGVLGSGISYLRLDGSTPPTQRQSLVDKFNEDSSIDLLLLTTQVGGLGLNLTGADVVVFIDHDWNPTKDLQAMDRAHRLGQKRTVNVYRIISKGTIEERIMGLQQFKTHIANTVVGEENRSLAGMATADVFDLLTSDTGPPPSKVKRSKDPACSNGIESKLNLPELWDASEYESAFDPNEFLNSL